MIVLSLLNAFVPKEIVYAVRAASQSGCEVRGPDNDPSLWRLRDVGEARIDDRSPLDRESADGRPEFPTI